MPFKRDVTPGEIAEYVRTMHGLDARHVAMLSRRAHAEAAVYRVDGHEGSYFLKLTPRQRVTPPPLARHLADSGLSQVLAPLRTRDGQLCGRLGGLRASLYPFVDGENGFQKPLSHDQWFVLGGVLRAVHDATPPTAVVEAVRHEGYSDGWRNKVRAYLTPLPPANPNDAVAEALIELLRTRTEQISALVQHADQLAAALRRKALPRVPCHGDLHAGNVLTDGGGSLMIVDWDDPVLAPKERDLMFIGAGIGGVWNREAEAAAFYRGYGPVAVDKEAIAYYRCERIVEDVAVFCDRLLLIRGEDVTVRGQMFRKLAAAFGPNDVVEIAESTFASL